MIDARRVFLNEENGETSIVCPKCTTVKSTAQFYYITRKKTGEKGYSSWCRECCLSTRKESVDPRIKISHIGVEVIHCPSCKEDKYIIDFYRRNYMYSKICKACTNNMAQKPELAYHG